MNNCTCSCLLRSDLEKSTNKLAFIKENYYDCTTSNVPIDTMSPMNLICFLCLLNSVLHSIEQESYKCTVKELTGLYRTREKIAQRILA